MVSSRYLFLCSPPKIVLALRPDSRPTLRKLTPRGVPGCSGSTGGFAGGADCDHKGRASPSTVSSEKTKAVRQSDFRTSRREEDKRCYLAMEAVLEFAPESLYWVRQDFASQRYWTSLGAPLHRFISR